MLPSIELNIPKPEWQINHAQKVMLIGSCFTEHIGSRLQRIKFETIENPNGILFNPLSVAKSIDYYLNDYQAKADELFALNGIWNHWQFHTRFSNIDKNECLSGINHSLKKATDFIQNTDFLIITLGSAFQYFLTDNNLDVANCHRAPGNWFHKRLISIEDILLNLKKSLAQLHQINPKCKVIFTISPVRHIREGVVENNRSKARLLEAVHTLVDELDYCFYFPAYEIVIDVLRDYRFYDIDMVHPNFQATQLVWEYFGNTYFSKETLLLNKQLESIYTAFNHKVRFERTEEHQLFLKNMGNKVRNLQQQHPTLNFEEELKYFS